MNQEQENTVVRALVGDEHRELYLTSAEFQYHLDSFVRFLLPVLVEGLAARAREKGEEFQAQLDQVLHGWGRGPTDRRGSDA